MPNRLINAAFGAGINRINQEIGSRVSGINNPLVRGGIQNLLDTALPGLGGGTPDLRDNAFGNLIQQRVAQSAQEFSSEIASPTQQTAGSVQLADSYDWRARLRPKKGGEDKFYSRVGVSEEMGGQALMDPIKQSGGLVWQNTPNIFAAGTADYHSAMMQGMNYPIRTFINSTPPDLPVQAEFSANDIYEARYMLAIFAFLKGATKAYFGDAAVASGDYGTPPPVLLFEYLGDHGFNKVPVVISNYTIQYPDDVDYVPVTVGNTITYVPTVSSILINLQPTYTPHKLRRRFDLDAVRSGAAYRDGFV